MYKARVQANLSVHTIYQHYSTACLSFDSEILCLHLAIFEYETKHQPLPCIQYYYLQTYILTYTTDLHFSCKNRLLFVMMQKVLGLFHSYTTHTGSTYKVTLYGKAKAVTSKIYTLHITLLPRSFYDVQFLKSKLNNMQNFRHFPNFIRFRRYLVV